MMSSLQNLCEVPAAVVFSNHPDIKKVIFSASITSFRDPSKYKKWNNDLQSVMSETFNNDYIAVFKWTNIRNLIYFIGREMLKWAETIQSHFDLPGKFIQHFIKSSLFTSKGQIDEEKAARELLKESRLSIFLQYEIACYYFIQDIAQTLWQQFDVKNFLNNEDSESPVALWSKYFEEINKPSITESEFENICQDFTVSAISYGTSNQNVAAIKFSFMPKSSNKKFDINEVDGNVKKLLTSYLLEVERDYDQYDFLNKISISKRFSAHQDISYHLFSVLEKEDRSSFLNNSDLVYAFLKCFLIWPHQNLFIKTAVEYFNVLMDWHFYYLLHDIADICEDPYLSETCNYRFLLRQFWIKSPSKLKKYVIKTESGGIDDYRPLRHKRLLLSKILNPESFSPDDEYNSELILESATLQEKEKILIELGIDFVDLKQYMTNLKLGQFYAKILNLNEDILKVFKEQYSFSIFLCPDLEGEECYLDNLNQFIESLFSPEEINNLKEEVFPTVFRKYVVTNSLLISSCSVEYFIKICKWFGKTDQEIEDWKINGVFDEILSSAVSTVVKRLFRNEILEDQFYDLLLFLCSNNKERVNEYIKELHVFCRQYSEEKICMFCWSNIFVSFENLKSRYICQLHPESEIPTSVTADEVCSSLLKHLNNLISKAEKEKL